MADEEKKEEGEAKEETKEEAPKEDAPKEEAPKEATKSGSEAPKDAPKEGTKSGSEAPKDAPKEAAKSGSEASKDGGAPPAAAAAAASGSVKNKTVKTQKNQFAMNRLLLMLMDVKPEELTTETIEDLKKVYALLVHIHSNYGANAT